MPKAKSWILIVLCLAGLLTLNSCTKNKYGLRIDYSEAGWYAVDVAKWTSVRVERGEEFWHTVYDATAELEVSFVDAGSYFPTYPNEHAVLLQSYSVTWKGTEKPPKTTGSLNILVPLDVTGGTPITVPIMVVPAINKDTSTVLSNLLGDPSTEDPNTFVGQLVCKATIELRGKDVVTDQEFVGSIELTGAFADYMEPNDYH